MSYEKNRFADIGSYGLGYRKSNSQNGKHALGDFGILPEIYDRCCEASAPGYDAAMCAENTKLKDEILGRFANVRNKLDAISWKNLPLSVQKAAESALSELEKGENILKDFIVHFSMDKPSGAAPDAPWSCMFSIGQSAHHCKKQNRRYGNCMVDQNGRAPWETNLEAAEQAAKAAVKAAEEAQAAAIPPQQRAAISSAFGPPGGAPMDILAPEIVAPKDNSALLIGGGLFALIALGGIVLLVKKLL